MSTSPEKRTARIGYTDAQKRRAAQVLAEGGSIAEAASESGAGLSTIYGWRARGDDEFYHWFERFELDDIARVGAEARNRQRFVLRPRLAGMAEEEIVEFCRRNGLTRNQFEAHRAREQETVAAVANRASTTRAMFLRTKLRAESKEREGSEGRNFWRDMLDTTAPADDAGGVTEDDEDAAIETELEAEDEEG